MAEPEDPEENPQKNTPVLVRAADIMSRQMSTRLKKGPKCILLLPATRIAEKPPCLIS